MRYSRRVVFVLKGGRSRYDPESDKIISSDDVEVIRPCAISDVTLERSKRIFGSYSESRKMVLLQRAFNREYRHVKVDGERYKVAKIEQGGKLLYVERDNRVES